jgi:hypothetical protein
VEHGIGRTAHGDIEGHGILKGGLGSDGTRQYRCIVLLVVTFAQFDNLPSGTQKELLAVGMGGNYRAITGQTEAECFGQAVHRVGSEHARAGTASRAGGTFDFIQIRLRNRVVGCLDHGIDEVEVNDLPLNFDLASLHRTAGNKITGMFRRMAAISMPGVILSQLEMQTMASAQ